MNGNKAPGEAKDAGCGGKEQDLKSSPMSAVGRRPGEELAGAPEDEAEVQENR